MTHEEQVKMIEAMKENREAFCFWPIEAKEWARKNSGQFERLWGGVFSRAGSEEFDPDYTYRLRPDYKAPGVVPDKPTTNYNHNDAMQRIIDGLDYDAIRRTVADHQAAQAGTEETK